MNDFYIILPSNINAKEYPNNKTSHFFTPLPKEINLYGEWNVALVEISFPQSWYNVEENITLIIYGVLGGRRTGVIHTRIPAGFYTNVEDLVNTINENVSSMDIKLEYNPYSKKCSLILKKNMRISFHKHLARMLGFHNYDFANDFTTTAEIHPEEINEDENKRNKRSIIPFASEEIALPDKF